MKLDVKRAILGVVISLAVFAFILPVAFIYICASLDQMLGAVPLMSQPIGIIFAGAAFVIGFFWIFWSYSLLLFVGKGSPMEVFGRALAPTRQLVTNGPYAYTRNPMVLGYLWVLLGIAFLMRSPSGIVIVPIITILSVLYLRYFEEPGLVRRFGEKYEHYRQSVPILVPAWRIYIEPKSYNQV